MYRLDKENMLQLKGKMYQIIFSNAPQVFAPMKILIGNIRFDMKKGPMSTFQQNPFNVLIADYLCNAR